MQVQPYLFFDGRCEEAAEFYRRTLGAEVVMSIRFKDGPDCQQPGMVPPGAEDKVMHMCLRVGDTTFMASDGRCLGQPNFQGFSLSLTVPREAEAERLFASLGDGGQVQMPLAKTFHRASAWSPTASGYHGWSTSRLEVSLVSRWCPAKATQRAAPGASRAGPEI